MIPTFFTTTLEITPIIIGLFGGLALFLFGLEQMTDAIKVIAGNRIKTLLARLTDNRFKAVLTGTVVTALIQSSSVTTVLVVGFVAAGLMSLSQSIGIIMGAQIGTTVTAQLIAFKITKYALVLVAAGFGLQFLSKRKLYQEYGFILMGLGLIFLGMNLMSEATQPLRTYDPFIVLMQRMDNPILAIIISAVFTGLVQSSSATIGIIIVLSSQGFITLEAGIALILGANIGTSFTALLATIGKPPEALQTALIHVLFNTVGALLWLGFIDQLVFLARWSAPTSNLTGVDKVTAEVPRQIANAHTIFNVANTLIFIWFTKPLAQFVRWLVPDSPSQQEETIKPKYLDRALLRTPDLALDGVRLELGRLGKYALKMVERVLPVIIEGDEASLSALAEMDDDVDSLYAQIVLYLRDLSKANLLRRQTETLSDYMAIANYYESIGDMIQTNLVETGEQRLRDGVVVSAETHQELAALYEKVYWAVEQSIKALKSLDYPLAELVSEAKSEVNTLAHTAETQVANRLTVDAPNRLAAFRVETEVIEHLKRIYYFTKRISRLILDFQGDKQPV